MKNTKALCVIVLACGFVAATATTLKAQDLYVGTAGSDVNDTIGEYGLDGSTINSSFISVPNDELTDMAISGNDLFVTSFYIYEFTTSGATVGSGAPFIADASHPAGVAISGDDMFVAYTGSGSVAEYTTSGATVKGGLITSLNQPTAIAISGDDLFIADSVQNTIVEYTTSGTLVSSGLLSGASNPHGILISGDDMYIANWGNGTIGEYTLSGTTINASLITGLSQPTGMAIYGNDLYVAEDNGGTVGEYTTSGATVNASLITGLDEPTALLIYPAPEPSALALAGLGAAALCLWRGKSRHSFHECARISIRVN